MEYVPAEDCTEREAAAIFTQARAGTAATPEQWAKFASFMMLFFGRLDADRGWTKTRVPKKVVDEVTGLEGIQWQDKFVPGVDFLGAALLGAGILAGVSIFVPAKSK